jgi:peptidoglycan/LPS O-acetylase OafA/YrhL
MVVAAHIGGIPAIGTYAVFGFYCLSGYLMTLIMQTNYGYSVSGFKKYSLNRFLRLYPIYWISILFTLVLIWSLGSEFTSNYKSNMALPSSLYEIFTNVAIFFPFLEPTRLTPPAWALTVEIFFYILIGFGLSKNKRITALWFFFSILYHIGAYVFLLGGGDRYFTIFAASLPFSAGALIFHHRLELSQLIKFVSGKLYNHLPLCLSCLFMLNWLSAYFLKAFLGVFFYMNFAICALLVAVLSNRKSLLFISKKFDSWLGDFSYPIYLFHYQVGLLVIVVLDSLGIELIRPDLSLMVISIPLLFILSWLVSLAVERPIERIRKNIKAKK